MKTYQINKKTITLQGKVTVYEMTDHKNRIRASVAPSIGAELCNLELFHDGKWQSIIYRGNDFSQVAGWQGRAPWLWPAVGRNFTVEQINQAELSGKEPVTGSYVLGENTYQMDCHGFAMKQSWSIDSFKESTDAAVLRLSTTSNDETRKYYPFDYLLLLEYKLDGDGLSINFQISADEGNDEEMPFGIGNHLTLKIMNLSGDGWQRMYFRSNATKIFGINWLSIPDGTSKEMDYSKNISLLDDNAHNKVIGGFQGTPYVEINDFFGRTVIVSQLLSGKAHLNDQLYFVFWRSIEAGYFCPEPWLGLPNSLNSGGPARLSPGEKLVWKMKIQTTE
ncbi:MAG: hypothetical protein U9R60_13610 [Bacteroidota bacterium]|nr:hypothetical protein [Bacteroidota bacterium]